MPEKEEKILEKPEVDPDGSENQADDLGDQLPDPAEKEDKAVSYATYKKTINELKTVKGKLIKVNKEIEAATDKNLIEQNKYEDLFNKEKVKNTEKDEKLKLKEVKILLQAEGMQDLDYAKILIDKIEFDDNLEATNAKEIFDELKEKKPYLFGETKRVLATDTQKHRLYVPKGHIYTNAEIRGMPIEDYKKNKDEIQRQEKAGLVK